MKNKRNKILILIIAVLALTCLLTACKSEGDTPPQDIQGEGNQTSSGTSGNGSNNSTSTITPEADTPYGRYGRLQVKGGQLCDELGNPVQLKGMSTHGLQWADGHWIFTENAFEALANDWQCDIIRLAMYVGENGYASDPATILERLEKCIQMASSHGMYVLVDWHVHAPGDPTDDVYLKAGLDADNMPVDFKTLRDSNPDWTGPQLFFGYISQKYGQQGNILYEPANEPNGLPANSWSGLLKPYYESVIEVIRGYDPGGIIICGTEQWCQIVDAPVQDPLDDPNVMYTLHFYAGTHDAGYNENPGQPGVYGNYYMRKMADNALANGLAIFATEWGTSEASGDGGPYIDFSERWLKYLDDNNISWCAWSLTRKYETSGAFDGTATPFPDGAWTDEELTISGRFYRAMIRGDAVPMYTADMQSVQNPSDGVNNGDIVHHVAPADLGGFTSFPITFESGTREGWAKEGTSIVADSDISVKTAETQALSFPFKFIPGNNAWEEGARLGSPEWDSSALPLNDCYRINSFVMDVYLEDGKASSGNIGMCIVLVPDGNPWWHEAGRVTLNPVNGGSVITNPDGVKLRKYEIEIPFSIADYPSEVRVRNIVLALYNDDSDYNGYVYYDNIGFIMNP